MNNQYLIYIDFPSCGCEFVFCRWKNGEPYCMDSHMIDGTQKQYIRKRNAERAKARLQEFYDNSPYNSNFDIKVRIVTI